MSSNRGLPLPYLHGLLDEVTDQCQEWPFARDRKGYGAIIYQGRKWRVPRLVLVLTGRPEIPGLLACHSCDTPSCCNPRHLRWDTPEANSQEMRERGRSRALLSEEEISWAALLVECGETKTAVAAAFGVSRQALAYRFAHRRAA